MSGTIDIVNLNGCRVCGEDGNVLAILLECDGRIVVCRQPACTLGDYMYILTYIRELGFEVK